MDVTSLSDQELEQLRVDVTAEQSRRATLATIPGAVNELNLSFLSSEGTVPGQAWRQPVGAHDAYPEGWEVLHNGKAWTSLVASNVWEPGVSSWREVALPTAPPPDWVQPTGAQDAYSIGDRVTFNGQIYESVIDANAWSPTTYPAGWKVAA